MPEVNALSYPTSKKRGRTRGDGGRGHFLNDVALWFKDGNIVIIAEDVAFRVHRGVLSRHSETFRDVFAIPQPDDADGDEKVDGCPALRVHDSAHDFKHLLHSLYDGLDTYTQTGQPIQFGTLAALMRLSHKYQLERIHAVALDLMKEVFTDNFEAWRIRDCSVHADGGGSTVAFKDTDAIEAYNLLRTCGLTSLLPVALYMCCAVEVRLLLRGIPRVDGTLEKLPDDDLERCLVARDVLELRNAALNRLVLNLAAPSRRPCLFPTSCITATHSVSALVGFRTRSETQVRHIFHHLLSDFEVPARAALCTHCAAFIPSSLSKFYDALWLDLPKILDLDVPNWPPAATT